MAGESARFRVAGYAAPKYRLPLWGACVFDHAVLSFSGYFASHTFLFIARDGEEAGPFIEQRARALGIASIKIVLLAASSGGQAETVAFGVTRGNVDAATPLTVFNIDTFRPGFRFPDGPWSQASEGFLEVMPAEDPSLSYVEPLRPGSWPGSGPGSGPVSGPGVAAEPLVARTAEKERISGFGSTGLYHFARASSLMWALDQERRRPTARELYIAPLYNHLIGRGERIHYVVADSSEVVFCGAPAQYEGLLDGDGRVAHPAPRGADPGSAPSGP